MELNPDIDIDSLPNLSKLLKEQRLKIYAEYISRGQIFGIEYSKSSRAQCKGCKNKIILGSIRARHIVCGNRCCKEKQTGQLDSCGCWHMECLLKYQIQEPEMFSYTNQDFTLITKTSQLAGFRMLQKNHQHEVEDILKKYSCIDGTQNSQ